MSSTLIKGYGLPSTQEGVYNGYGRYGRMASLGRLGRAATLADCVPAGTFRPLPDPELGGYGGYGDMATDMQSTGQRLLSNVIDDTAQAADEALRNLTGSPNTRVAGPPYSGPQVVQQPQSNNTMLYLLGGAVLLVLLARK